MIEKVNPSHPDKIADRIAGALVDMAYELMDNPKIAVEILIGHGNCNIIAETSVNLSPTLVEEQVKRITGDDCIKVDYREFHQDPHLADNQCYKIRCGDNGIFKGTPLSQEERNISCIARAIYSLAKSDGKYVLDGNKLIICQSGVSDLGNIFHLIGIAKPDFEIIYNPLGYWSGGLDVDTGATNRKLGSDMARSVTGGGIHGKDLSKADVTINTYLFLEAQKQDCTLYASCAIGDKIIKIVDSWGRVICEKAYKDMAEEVHRYINRIGGFEKLAEWGLF